MNMNIYIKILDVLSENEFISARELANFCNCSDKTIRTRIEELKNELEGGQIESRRSKGYSLKIIDEKKFLNSKGNMDNFLGNNLIERIQELMFFLLMADRYYTLEELSEIIFVSAKTMSKYLSKVEKKIIQYDLIIDRKPNYGIKLKGQEYNIRHCLSDVLFKFQNNNRVDKYIHKKISKILNDSLLNTDINISDVARQNLLSHIYVMIQRIKKENYSNIDEKIFFDKNIQNYLKSAKDICNKLSSDFKLDIPINEIYYVAIQLAGKSSINSEQDNFFVSSETIELVDEILAKVSDAFEIDLNSNLELKINLYRHFVPMVFRLKFSVKMPNPLLEQIKEKHLYAYTISEYIALLLKNRIGKEVSGDEIGYIALYITMALDRVQEYIKNNILIVCGSGLGISKLLVYNYKEKFDRYLDKVDTCSYSELKFIDLKVYDYVFTTVPIKEKLSIPILEVNNFLDETEILSISQTLKKKSYDINKYYSKDLFMNIKSKESVSRLEVIHEMCKQIRKYKKVGEEFESSVIARENLTTTEFGNYVALTHPIEPVTDTTFASVAILENPITWKNKTIKVIWLISIEKSKHKDIQSFYKVTSKLLMSTKLMEEFLKEPTFDMLMKKLYEAEDVVREQNG